MNTCTTCPNGVGNWLQNQNPCPDINCACDDNIFSSLVETVPTHYYQCKDIGFKDCDNDDLIKLQVNGNNENIFFLKDVWDPIAQTTNTPEVEWCRINNEIALSETELIEANAMYSIQTANDYFTGAFNINSYDNNGGQLIVIVHAKGVNANGASSSIASNPAPAPMSLGDGAIGECNPMVSLDIVAHEYTHGVLNNYINLNQNLVTTTELRLSTVAIQEALADIFSIIIRHDENGGQNTWNNQSIWTIGAEACFNHPNLPRYVNAPQNSVSTQASYYQDPVHNWSNNQMDYYNRAGVISYWFYLLSTGQQGVKGDVIQQALNVNGSENIIIEALNLMENDIRTQYTFEDFRDFTIQAAINLHGVCTNQHRSIVEAWVAVGLLDCANINISFEENDPTPADPCDKELTAIVNNGSGCYNFEWFRIDNGVEIPLNLNGVTIPVLCNNTYRVKVVDTF
ncbi:MAG: M4 family metallopeptidase [Saprospiraceae bacterium]|nr:M4 family metallopeptidase [Saprospiraceae bacterium]